MILTWSEIKRVVNGSASKKEVERFDCWLNESPEHRDYFEKVKYSLQNGEKAELENLAAKHYSAKQIYGRKRYSLVKNILKISCSVAAAMVLLYIANNYLTRPLDSVVEDVVTVAEVKIEKENSNNEIKLTTQNGEEYDVNVDAEFTNLSNVDVVSDKLIYKAVDSAKEKIEYHTISVPFGKTFIVELADGTTAHLNACSSLKYPVTFRKGESREVFLEGEGYFTVTKNSKDRFIVKIGNLDVIVYGTMFNVNGYEENIETVLVEGSVAIKLDGHETKITPNQKIEVVKSTNETIITNVNVDKYISWKRNYFTFEDERMEDIVKSVKRWYNVDIEFKNRETADILINCNIPKYKSISDFLDVLKNTGGINYSVENGKYIIK